MTTTPASAAATYMVRRRASAAVRAPVSSGTNVSCQPGSHGPAAIASLSAGSPGGIAMKATPSVSI
jgi:hypothetical protein